MPVNASPEYYRAYAEYLNAKTIEEKIRRLEEAIRIAPKHKSSETLLAQLRSRLSKLKKESEIKSRKGGGKKGIKKTGDAQMIILGTENSGKSSLLARITHANPIVSELPFTTAKPEIGTLDLEGLKAQVIEMPANASSEYFSMVYGADLLLILAKSLKDIIKWTKLINDRRIKTRRIFVFNNKNDLDYEELKKIRNLKGMIEISLKEDKNVERLKESIFENLNLIRIYTKEPGKEKSEIPMILERGAKICDMAEKIHKEYPKRFLKARIWGKSAKFDGQTVGIEHKLEDKDVVELYIK